MTGDFFLISEFGTTMLPTPEAKAYCLFHGKMLMMASGIVMALIAFPEELALRMIGLNLHRELLFDKRQANKACT